MLYIVFVYLVVFCTYFKKLLIPRIAYRNISMYMIGNIVLMFCYVLNILNKHRYSENALTFETCKL